MKAVSKTAYLTAGVRMLDAQLKKPVCGDDYAETFMNEEGREALQKFRKLKKLQLSIVQRHRIIDDFLRKELSLNSQANIVIIGAGFDTRAYRLNGGSWTEIDEHQLIHYKNEKLPPSECKNALSRISISFEDDSLRDALATFKLNGPVIVVLEGVFVYLEEEAVRDLLDTLKGVFGPHYLICDLASRSFINKYGKKTNKQIQALGATFKYVVDNPEKDFEQFGYEIRAKASPIEAVMTAMNTPAFLMKTLLKGYLTSNFVYLFEFGSESR